MDLHFIHKEAIDSVLDTAKQYRSLLEPDLAISICLDIFAVDPDNQETLVIYILALTDTLANYGTNNKLDKKIKSSIKKLQSDYQQNYYQGIFYERKARTLMNHAMSSSFAYDLLLKAIEHYKKAEKLTPKNCDDAVLRYNACVRTIDYENLQPRQDTHDVDWYSES